MLERVGVSPDSIDSELREMSTIAIGITRSRSVLGSLNELSFLARYSVHQQSRTDLTALAEEIASIPEFIRGYGPVKERHLRDAAHSESCEGTLPLCAFDILWRLRQHHPVRGDREQ